MPAKAGLTDGRSDVTDGDDELAEARFFRSDLPQAAEPWTPPPAYSFVGGHNDPANVPFGGLAEALTTAMRREGQALAAYNLGGSPLGYRPLRQFVCDKLGDRASMAVSPDQVLVTSGSLQALDLVNEAVVQAGDTVLIEQATYGGMLSRLDRLGVRWVGIDLDDDGLVPAHLDSVIGQLDAQGVSPRYLYTIPTVQNPTGSVMPESRRRQLLEVATKHDLLVFEDDCYADLVWRGQRPPTIRALDDEFFGGGRVIYCGSFSKSVAPALRVGYLVADEAMIGQLLALKTDAGTGALEQLALAEYGPENFDAHVTHLTAALQAKCEVMRDAVARHFGPEVEVTDPNGGIYVWLTFSDGVDTSTLAAAAGPVGVEFNPGAGWSADPEWGRRRLRLCFGHPDAETIESGVARLAEAYRSEG